MSVTLPSLLVFTLFATFHPGTPHEQTVMIPDIHDKETCEEAAKYIRDRDQAVSVVCVETLNTKR